MTRVIYPILLALVGSTAGGWAVAADPPPKAAGVVVDFRGPPEGGNFSIDYIVTLEGQKDPHRRTVSHGGYSPKALDGAKISWELQGYVVEKVGLTQLRIIGRKDKDGKVIPVKDIKFESKDLCMDQLPTVVREKA